MNQKYQVRLLGLYPAELGKAIDTYGIINTETGEIVLDPIRIDQIDALVTARRWSTLPMTAPDAPMFVRDGFLEALAR